MAITEIKFNINVIYFWNFAVDKTRIQAYSPLLEELSPDEVVTIKIRQAVVQCRKKDMMPLLIDIEDYPSKTGIDIKKDNTEIVAKKILTYLEGE